MAFQEYLSQKYQGHESFIENIIFPIFGEDNYETAWDVELLDSEELQNQAERTGIRSILRCGTIILDLTPIEVFDITVSDRVMMDKNRVGVQAVIRRVMDTYSGAFMLIHYDHEEKWDWRFTFCQLKDKSEFTDSKRYTFLLGPNQSCKTAAQNFQKLAEQHEVITIKDIVSAFDVEAVSKDFFEKYKKHYEDFVEYITGKRFVKDKGSFVEKTSHAPHAEYFHAFGNDDKAVRDYTKLLLARIVFLHFLQKKGWLGVPEGGRWGEGDEQFMLHLFEKATDAQKDDFLESVLEPLFFDALNGDRADKKDVFDTKVLGKVRIPYLNGGLFSRDSLDYIVIKYPREYFGNFLHFLYEYNFTIDENDPNEAQVGIDPEMLGKIFENLLEDNKDKGAFYTPKEIVQYMCQESLVAYLVTKTGYEEEKLRSFVKNPDVFVDKFSDKEKDVILGAILSVKICDPAIGSGAFPIGLLNELVRCKEAIFGEEKERAEIKKEIIRDNIYGVDIEKGAVDIARLRFWLSLIVDEPEPLPLPNLDYKIMQGNSLLESYNGVDLSHLTDTAVYDDMFGGGRAEDLKNSLARLLKDYYGESNHIKKAELRARVSETIKEIMEIAAVDIPNDIDLAGNSYFFLWHTWFADVFKRPKGCDGFDIVIGNPPYGATLSFEIKDIYKKLFKDVHMRTPDTFNYFISNGIRLLHTGGVLSYIIPNTLLSQNEYIKARGFLYEMNTLNEVVNIGENVFKEADVPTCIIRVRKGVLANYFIRYADYKDVPNESIIWGNGFTIIPASTLEDIPGHVIGVEQSGSELLRKIKNMSITIDDIAYEMAAGISTGCNKAFCVNEDIISRFGIERGILMPLLKGENIDRYAIAWDKEYIIYTTKETDITLYPKVKEYASAYKEKLDKRRETKKGMIPWWALNWPRYRALFEGEKIIMRQTSDSIRAVFDDQNYYPLNSILTLRLKDDSPYTYYFVLGVLNSSVTNYVYQSISQEKGRAFAEVKPINVRKLYVPRADKLLQEKIENLVKQILNNQLSRENGMKQIDQLLFTFYQISPEDLV